MWWKWSLNDCDIAVDRTIAVEAVGEGVGGKQTTVPNIVFVSVTGEPWTQQVHWCVWIESLHPGEGTSGSVWSLRADWRSAGGVWSPGKADRLKVGKKSNCFLNLVILVTRQREEVQVLYDLHTRVTVVLISFFFQSWSFEPVQCSFFVLFVSLQAEHKTLRVASNNWGRGYPGLQVWETTLA